MLLDDLRKDLEKLGYKKFKEDTKTRLLVYVPKNERAMALDEIVKKMDAVHDKSADAMRKVSSLGAIIWTSGKYEGFMVGIKPDASKSLSTDEQETFAGIHIATLFNHPRTDFSYEELVKYGDPSTKSKFSTKDLYEKAGRGWIASSQIVAKTLSPYLDGKYEVHQRSGSKFEANISTAAKKLIAEAGWRIGMDKWNPADIWLVKPKHVNTDFNQFKTINQLNDWLMDMFDKKEVLGISLKAVGKNAKVEIYNKGKKLDPRFTKYDTGKTGFVKSLAGTIYWNTGSMDIRNFGRPENISGEINGQNAQGGKVGHGPLINIWSRYDKTFKTMSHQEVTLMYRTKPEHLYKILWDKFGTLDPQGRRKYNSQDEMMLEIEEKGNKMNYLISKIQVSDFITSLNKLPAPKKNALIKDLIGYASSSLDVSSVFYKVS